MNGYASRFSGIQRLYGTTAQHLLHHAHVAIVGVGGVGSWSVEALARTGIGTLTLIDMDDVCISNTNRQLHALAGQTGRPKVDALADRIRAINPDAVVHAVQQFFTASNAEELLATRPHVLIDAIDSVQAKCLLIARCLDRGIPVVTAGGAGGRRDPTRIRIADLARSTHDGLLQEVRRTLRRDHGFPRDARPFGVPAVFSTEPPVFPTPDGCVTTERSPDMDLRLDCRSGYGTATHVTGAFGFAAAAAAIDLLTRQAESPSHTRLPSTSL